ncbi:MAG: hypothetical protein ACHP8B_18650 [Terriglobales bacterium]
MRFRHVLLFMQALLALGPISCAQGNGPKLENATAAVVHAFETHDIVMLGEAHGNKQEYEWLRSLVATPEFADRVDDVVVEFGNSLYQKSVDRYVSGEDVPLEQVQKAWRNLVGAFGPPSPVYGSLYRAVRETNLKRRGMHQLRIVCGDPYIDWEKVKDREDIAPYLGNRELWYTQVVKDEVLAKHHRALLIMGSGHFLRRSPSPSGHGLSFIEQQLQADGGRTYLIVFGTNVTGGYDDIDHRFDSWSRPVIVSMADNWVGELPALAVVNGGAGGPRMIGRSGSGTAASAPPPPPLKLKDAADALLYLGSRDSLTAVNMPRAELEGTPYGKEMERRLTIEGFPVSLLLSQTSEKEEVPQFSRPQPSGGAGPPPLPPPPKNMGAPLPPPPPSQ